MKKIMCSIILFLPLLTYAQDSAEEDAENAEGTNLVIEMMVVAKATGMCGVFSQMVSFQEATKMPGGDDFIVRFMNTEAVRLGHTLESFLSQCQTAVERYNSDMEMLGFEE